MNCVFCEIAKKNLPSSIIYEDEKVMSFMDINPICDGHVLIIPKDHYETMIDTPSDIIAHMYDVAKKLTPIVMDVTGEKGVTYSINYGDKQEVLHLHLHILPDYTKPATMSIEDTYQKIMERINEKTS